MGEEGWAAGRANPRLASLAQRRTSHVLRRSNRSPATARDQGPEPAHPESGAPEPCPEPRAPRPSRLGCPARLPDCLGGRAAPGPSTGRCPGTPAVARAALAVERRLVAAAAWATPRLCLWSPTQCLGVLGPAGRRLSPAPRLPVRRLRQASRPAAGARLLDPAALSVVRLSRPGS